MLSYGCHLTLQRSSFFLAFPFSKGKLSMFSFNVVFKFCHLPDNRNHVFLVYIAWKNYWTDTKELKENTFRIEFKIWLYYSLKLDSHEDDL